MWVLFLACGGAIPVGDSDDAVPADTDVPDPRFDRANWPDTVGGDRPAAVVYPADWDGEPLPLVVLLHGYGANGSGQDLYFGLSARVDRGYALVLPDGTKDASGLRFWNATDYCCDFGHTNVDDVAYVTGLIDEMEAKAAIDPDRVLLAGHSNGGFMSYRMACDRSDRLAGIAALAGATWLDEARCGDPAPVPVLHVHGTSDPTILYEGTSLYPGAEDTTARWANRDGCGGVLSSTTIADFDSAVPGDETSVETWPDCDVTLWKMQGSSHIPLVDDAWKDALVDWLLAQHK